MSSFTTSMASMYSSICLAWISAWTILRRPWRMSGREAGFSSRAILPLSMRLMSSTSLIRLSRWLLEVMIFFR